MAMSEAFRNYILDGGDGADIITHIGLIDETGTELTGGSPAYARLAVTWGAASAGVRRPTENLLFDVPAGKVKGWRGFTALTGGTNYGGEALTEETFAAQGQYRLLAATTGIRANDPA